MWSVSKERSYGEFSGLVRFEYAVDSAGLAIGFGELILEQFLSGVERDAARPSGVVDVLSEVKEGGQVERERLSATGAGTDDRAGCLTVPKPSEDTFGGANLELR